MAERPTLEQRVRRFIGFDELARRVDLVSSTLAEIATTVRRAVRPPPGPFVCVLVEGLVEDPPIQAMAPGGAMHLAPGMLSPRPVTSVRHVFTGASGRVTQGGGALIELTAQMRMHDVRVIVFADLERVRVHGIFVGVEALTAAAAFSDCPTARFERWEPGVKLRVQCDAVEP